MRSFLGYEKCSIFNAQLPILKKDLIFKDWIGLLRSSCVQSMLTFQPFNFLTSFHFLYFSPILALGHQSFISPES
jgi:hypothetical protein